MHRPPPPPFRPYSVHFAYKGSTALRLVDPTDDTFLGQSPEWVEGSRSVDAAYLKASRVTVQVIFILSGGSPDGVGRRQGDTTAPGGTIDATCSWQPNPKDPSTWLDLACVPGTALKFNPTGLSDPIEFSLTSLSTGQPSRLPDRVGSWHINWLWQWHKTDGTVVDLGITDHVVHTTWKPLLSAEPWIDSKAAFKYSPVDGDHVAEWTYLPIVQWTCVWVQETDGAMDNERAFCDAMIKNLPRSRLCYYVMAWSVKDMLAKGGGMCGGWYKMFQAMAAAHGITLERRMFLVDRVDHSTPEAPDVKWDAIVVRKGGVGLPYPMENSTTFHDATAKGPAVGKATASTERRYRFWGTSNAHHDDGHCVNFLKDTATGKYILYDASFATAGLPLELTELPPPTMAQAIDAWDVGNFKEAYLDDNIEYLMGSLVAGKEPYKAFWDFRMSCSEAHHISSFNGVTVATKSITDRAIPIPFFWGP